MATRTWTQGAIGSGPSRVRGAEVLVFGEGADAEESHEVERVSGVFGLVEDAIGSQLVQAQPEAA
jgi:hypothetical protein